MAISDKINSIKQHLGEAYASLEEKQAVIPENKNIENLAESILTITGGEDVTTETENYGEKIVAQEEKINDIKELLKTKMSGGGEPLDYIQDGLICWYEGMDEADSENKWHSRIGEDYYNINGVYMSFNINDLKNERAYRNEEAYSFINNTDFFKNGYTIELVGKANKITNRDGTSGATLMSFNRKETPSIQVYNSANGTYLPVNKSAFLNDSSMLPKKYTNLKNKRCTFVLHFSRIPENKAGGNCVLGYSLNGEPMNYTGIFNLESTTNDAINVLMGYYTGYKYYMCWGEVNSIRIYNRLLTDEEIKANYEIDKSRFKDISDYVEE